MQGEQLLKKMEGSSITIPPLINGASDYERVQKEFLIKESQKGLDEPSVVTERFREIRRGEDLPPFSELMQSEEFVKNLSIRIPVLINGASDSERHEQKQLQKSHQPSSPRTKRDNSMPFMTQDRVRAAFLTLLQKEDFVSMIWPEILKEMLRDYYK